MKRTRIRKNKSRREKRATAGRNRAGGRMILSVAGLFCLSLFFILGNDIMTQGRMFAATEIEVAGNSRISRDEILELAGIREEMNIFALNLGVARKRLLADGRVAEARVGREIPDGLVVRVREHEPMLVLEMEERLLMSREATVMEQLGEGDAIDLPLVTGLDYSDLPLDGEGSDAFAALMRVARVVESGAGALSLAGLRRIHVDRELGVTLYAEEKVRSVRMGFDGYDEKMRRVERLLAALDRGESDPLLEITELEDDKRIVAGPF